MKKTWKNICFLLLAVLILAGYPQITHAAVSEAYGDYTVYNVTEYGADPTGAQACDAAISSALRAARKNSGKKLLYFPAGSYTVHGTVKLASRMVLAADEQTVVTGTGSKLINLTGASGAVIDGGTWRGRAGSTVISGNSGSDIRLLNMNVESGLNGIKLRATTAYLENVTISKSTSIGMGLSGQCQVTAKGCKILNNGSGYPKQGLGHGVGVYEKSVFNISDSQLNGNRECGISVKNGTAFVTNCKLYNNGRHGLGTALVCNVTMTNCDIYKNGLKDKHDGVILVGGSKGTFTNCKFRANAATGLLVNDSNTRAVIKKCIFKNNKAHNIYSENLKSGKVSLVIDSCSFYKCKTSDSVRIHVNKKSAYSLKIKGKNKYYKVKPKYTFWIKNKLTYKK